MRHVIPRSLAAIVVSMSLFGVLSALAGCTFIDAQLQRTAPPDTRVKLGWHDRVFVYSRDVTNYTCEKGHLLMCDGGGAITLQCRCVLR